MLQNDHSFLFPQIHFGRLEDLDETDLDEDLDHTSVISFDTNLINPLPQKIGLYINWLEDF